MHAKRSVVRLDWFNQSSFVPLRIWGRRCAITSTGFPCEAFQTFFFAGPPSLHALDSAKSLFEQIQGVDAPPAERVKAAVGDVRRQATSLIERWKNILAQDVPALNNELQTASLTPINIAH